MKLGLKLGLGISKSNRVALGFLDEFSGALTAVSFRYLSNEYTGDVVLVRRSSDNSEQGFTPTEITDGTLESFCGAGDGFVKTLYDQSGNGNDFTNAITANQPKIVSSGTLITENGKPGMLIDGLNDELRSSSLSFSQPISIINILKLNTISSFKIPFAFGNAIYIGTDAASPNKWRVAALTSLSSTQNATTEQTLLFSIANGVSSSISVNSVNTSGDAGTNAGSSSFVIGDRLAGGSDIEHIFQESIVYNSDQSANRTAIETAINSYYSIY